LLIEIEYQVRATTMFFNLVYPFYLERKRELILSPAPKVDPRTAA